MPRAADRICLLFVAAYVVILASALALSATGRLNSLSSWAVAIAVCGAAAAVGLRCLPEADAVDSATTTTVVSTLPRPILAALALSIATALTADVVVMLNASPAAWDALAYHLPKMAYALQRGSFGMPASNYWAQQVHPDGSTALLVFAWQLFHSERLMAIWQLLAVVVAAAGVWKVALRVSGSPSAAAFGALAFLATTQALVQANTVGNDAILAALAACALAWLLDASAGSQPRGFVLAPVAAGLGLATKAAFALVIPLLAAVAVFALARVDTGRRRTAVLALAAGCVFAAAMAWPAGYGRNAAIYGHLLGPEHVRREHTFEAASSRGALAGGSLNVLRYGVEFVALDGLPRIAPVNDLQRWMRGAVRAALAAARVDLESGTGTRAAFNYERIATAHEAHSYWGVVGLLILWPAVVAALRRRSAPMARLLAVSAIAFVLVQAYSGPYDPWRGRYFLACAVFAAPLAAKWAGVTSRGLRAFRDASILVVCVSAVGSTLLRSNFQLLPVSAGGGSRASIVSRDRLSQITANRPDALLPLRAFDAIVPRDATVAVRLAPGAFEFPLFGEGLTRRIEPAPPGVDLAALGAFDYLLFDEQFEMPQPQDRVLGGGWWLRTTR